MRHIVTWGLGVAGFLLLGFTVSGGGGG